MSGASPGLSRVYVIDDDPSVLAVVENLLRQADYDVIPFLSAAQFLSQFQSLPRGVVVTDQVMHDAEGTEVQRRLSVRPNDFRVILVTAFPRTSLAVAAMKAGAVTVLDKPFDRAELLEAVAEGFRQLEDLHSNEQALPPLLPDGKTYFNRLSDREQEVIRLVYEGATNKSIGIQLGISIKTVEKHRGKGMKKMQVGSLAGLIRLLDREFGKS
ncbi:MAG: response regulator transcription factor [Planctomycetaceae bacterium]|nr:response regulator transcription factor [Planctomycetaceae bacterium]